MGLLQAVAAAAEVAAAAAAAAVSAASINHLSSPSPVRDEGRPRCPRSPFSPSPPPPQSTARKTLHFRGGAKRARPAGCPSRSGAGHPKRMRSPSPPPTPAQLGLLLWRWRRRRAGNPLRSEFASPCPLPPLAPVGPGTRSAAVAPPLSRCYLRVLSQPRETPAPTASLVVSRVLGKRVLGKRVLGKAALFGGSKGGRRGPKRALL